MSCYFFFSLANFIPLKPLLFYFYYISVFCLHILIYIYMVYTYVGNGKRAIFLSIMNDKLFRWKRLTFPRICNKNSFSMWQRQFWCHFLWQFIIGIKNLQNYFLYKINYTKSQLIFLSLNKFRFIVIGIILSIKSNFIRFTWSKNT